MRKHYLDHIRWLTVVLVLIYHVFYLFNHAGVLGGVAALAGAEYADSLLYFVYPWFMVLLFTISGISTRYALERKPVKQFIRERAGKLLVPSTLGLFVYQWITGYFNIKIGGALGQIPPLIRYPIFVVSGIGPLWFIQTLFLFSMMILLVRRLDAKDRLWSLCTKANLPLLLLLAIPIWGVSHLFNMPVVTVYRFGIYFFAYLLGYFIFSHDEVVNRLAKASTPLALVSTLMGIAYTFYYFGSDYTSPSCLQSLFTNVYLWMAVLTVLGCAKAWCTGTSALTCYLNRVSFGWYLLHYPILIAVCYGLVHLSGLPVFWVYLIALAVEFIVTATAYEVLSRIPVVRFLVLGMTAKKR